MEQLIEHQSLIILLMLIVLAEILACLIFVMHMSTHSKISDAKFALSRDIQDTKFALERDIQGTKVEILRETRTLHYELMSDLRRSSSDHNAIVRQADLRASQQIRELESRLRQFAIRN